MARLVVNPGSPDTWEIELKPGSNSLGRSDSNDIALEHDSISSAHCVLIVSGANARLKDVGSTNGTFVGGQLVEEATLSNGQSFQAGDVELRFLAEAPPNTPSAPVVRIVSADAAPIPRPPPLPSATGGADATHCKSHPRTAARFLCPKCHLGYCELCVNTRAVGGLGRKFCRACGAECSPLQVRTTLPVPARQTFPEQVAAAFSYPFKRDGLILLAGGTLFLCLIKAALFFCKYAFLYGIVATVVLGVWGTGFFISFFRRIVAGSATGEDVMPDWPDVTDFSNDILAPFLQFVGTVALSFLPAIGVFVFVPKDFAYLNQAQLAGLALGYAYFPMAFLAVSMLDSVVAANPLLVLQGILKMPWNYLLTAAVFGGVMVVKWTGDEYLPHFLPVPLVPAILSSFLGLYLLTVFMRILGLLYRDNKEKLGWFDR